MLAYGWRRIVSQDTVRTPSAALSVELPEGHKSSLAFAVATSTVGERWSSAQSRGTLLGYWVSLAVIMNEAHGRQPVPAQFRMKLDSTEIIRVDVVVPAREVVEVSGCFSSWERNAWAKSQDGSNLFAGRWNPQLCACTVSNERRWLAH